jgi:hypothetical protein
MLLLVIAAGPAWPQVDRVRDRSGAISPCGGPASEDRLTGVSDAGEIVLGSGRVARLADLRWPDEARFRSAVLPWLRDLVGQAVEIRVGPPDRWNRHPARIVLGAAAMPAGPGPVDMAGDLVRNGLALVDPGEAEGLCERTLLASEAEARRERLGLWAEEDAPLLPASATGALRERVGAFAIVEGRVRSVGERERRTYLNFGSAWAEDFTVTIPKRSWAILARNGVSASDLRGRPVRVRGVLEEWNGPALTLSAADALEILDRAPSPVPANGPGASGSRHRGASRWWQDAPEVPRGRDQDPTRR